MTISRDRVTGSVTCATSRGRVNSFRQALILSEAAHCTESSESEQLFTFVGNCRDFETWKFCLFSKK